MKPYLLLLFIALLSFHSAQAQDENLKTAIQAEMDQDNYKKAIGLCKEGLKKNPRNLYYLTSQSYCHQQLGQIQEAYNVATLAIEYYPDSAAGFNTRGGLLLSLGINEEAQSDFKRELDLAENDEHIVGAMVNIAATQLRSRQFKEARSTLEKAYEINPESISVLINLAHACSELDHHRQAIVYLEQAAKVDSSFMAVYTNLGFTYQIMEEYDKSLEYFDIALSLEPDDAVTLNNRAYSKMKSSDLKGALADVNKSIKLYPANPYAFRNRALIYIEMGKNTKACSDIAEALAKDFTAMYGSEVEELQFEFCN